LPPTPASIDPQDLNFAGLPSAPQLAWLSETPTHAYYFATPQIFRPQAGLYSADRLQELIAIYVDGFWELAQALRARRFAWT
jgi:hypothetical protein